jgi:hypothetical protein
METSEMGFRSRRWMEGWCVCVCVEPLAWGGGMGRRDSHRDARTLFFFFCSFFFFSSAPGWTSHVMWIR